MIKFLPLFLFLSLPCLAALEDEKEIKAIEKAHAAVDSVKKEFKQRLMEAVQTGDLEKAIPSCKIKVPKPKNMKVGRTSHRLRNPNNAPPEWTKAYLEKFSKAKAEDIPKYVITPLGKNRYGYMQPIFVEPICLNCHGRYVAKDVKAAIRKEYPKDMAINFDVGDFRGLIWLEFEN
ncbi:MAG: DUF3365 domain-containing protein [Bdellovibrionaceae bacterium]|nr:DUF3365 domain-containing protein [Bdellovibrionales bacterium]MCB9255427.1 DUF3365 domain-containing protein [Pseudobdellovibrionaceae bacterium]